MQNELIEYIYNYYKNFFTAAEEKAAKLAIGLANTSIDNLAELEKNGRMNFYTGEAEAKKLLEDGIHTFARRVSERIYMEHQNELFINRCPYCNNVARTPKARQCRYCRTKW